MGERECIKFGVTALRHALTRLSYVILAVLATVTLIVSENARSEERIHSFLSEIVINQDGSMDVTETISVRAEGNSIRRGIYRDFPTKYTDTSGNRYSIDFEFKAALRDGVDEHWHTQSRSNGMRVYIGKSNVVLEPGDYTYTLKYRTGRQLGFFKEHDELYWNVTGNGWSLPIDSAVATVVLPVKDQIIPGTLQLQGYTGRQGDRGEAYQAVVESGVPTWQTTEVLQSGEGLTVVLGWPKGIVSPPSLGQKVRWFVRDNIGIVVGIAGFLLTFLYLVIAWWIKGRDPEGQPIFARFDPPEGVSPGSARYLHRMKYDNKVFTASIINLAVKGYITIEQSAAKKAKITKIESRYEDPLEQDEQLILNQLFGDSDSVSLESGTHAKFVPVRKAVTNLMKETWYGSHFVRNGWWLVPGIVLAVITIMSSMATNTDASGLRFMLVMPLLVFLPVLFVFLRNPDRNLQWWLTISILMIPLLLNAKLITSFMGWGFVGLTICFAWMLVRFSEWLCAPTVEGRKVMDHIEGLKLYIRHAESERLNMLNPPSKTPKTFEKYLPWALALDLENEWAEQFEDVLREAGQQDNYAPNWYRGSHWNRTAPLGFAAAMGGAMTATISSATSRPGSSSGFSSGGSSGGYSGGGGGGGGGGGW